MAFSYDHLNSTGDVEIGKVIGLSKNVPTSQHLSDEEHCPRLGPVRRLKHFV